MLSGIIARARSLWRALRRHADVDADMKEEFHLHLELRAADLVRAGLLPAEAARQARLEFGGTARYTDEGRASRGLQPFDNLQISWLDFKLGFRMLVKYPGLTVVGGVAIAFAVAVSAGTFEVVKQFVSPTIPLDDGDRIVAIRIWDAAAGRREARTLHDFLRWRAELQSVDDLGAYRTAQRNLITDNGGGEPLEVAEISASGFRMTRVAPLLGRSLVEGDEQVGAANVVVIGYDVWQKHFAADSGVIGRTVRLGRASSTVVGVMPKGYAFPIYHGIWVPLRLNVLDYKPGRGPEIRMFGRLARGVTLDQAQTELTSIGIRRDPDVADARAQLRPQIMPYAKSVFDASGIPSLALISIDVVLALLLVLVFGNVALLVFARAATRESEIVVRSALGASRQRIIMQLFAEALVLGGVGAVAGLVAAGVGLQWGLRVLEADAANGRLPFWFADHMAPSTVLYALVLTLLGAVIAGVMPAFKVTRGIESRLRRAAAGGGGLQFSGVWTAVIVAQVAVTVACPVTVFFTRRDRVQIETLDVGFPAKEYLAFGLHLDRDNSANVSADTSRAAFAARFRTTYEDFERRFEAEPGIAGVSFADLLPGMDHPQQRIEVDGIRPATTETTVGPRVSSATIGLDYFDVVGAPMLAGRSFNAGDLESKQAVAIVNKSFVRQVLGGRNPVGQRVRYVDATDPDDESSTVKPGPWLEIVGEVRDLGMTDGSDPQESGAGLYLPTAPSPAVPLQVIAHVRAAPASFTQRLRGVALAVDPTLRVDNVLPVDRIQEVNLRTIAFFFQLLVALSSIALLLSLTGIYAVMSFTVSRRTREIGIRVALGANAMRVVAAIFARPLAQVGLGVIAGGVLVALMVLLVFDGLSMRELGLIVAYAALMMGVSMLACIVPTRRALRIEPTEALRADG